MGAAEMQQFVHVAGSRNSDAADPIEEHMRRDLISSRPTVKVLSQSQMFVRRWCVPERAKILLIGFPFVNPAERE
jgi:hypothetical protein